MVVVVAVELLLAEQEMLVVHYQLQLEQVELVLLFQQELVHLQLMEVLHQYHLSVFVHQVVGVVEHPLNLAYLQ
jgi:hypothetical protein